MNAPDATLVARVRAKKDRAAFEVLVRRHQSAVRRWLRHLATDFAVADDLAQETFIKAWDKIGTYQGKGSFKAWLMRVAYTQFLQAGRRRGRYRKMTEEMAERNPAAALEPPAPGVSDLERFLAVVSEPERRVLVLTHAHGLSHQDVSEVTGWPLGTVKSHLRRGKTKIRQRFRIEEPVG